MAGVSAARGTQGSMGIVAPFPTALIAGNIKARQRVEIRPGEPVYIFSEGAGGSLKGLNKSTPFTITRSSAPIGVPVPRTMGQWFKISLKPGQPAGKKDQINFTRTVGGDVITKNTPFTLVSGSQRWF